MSGPGAAVLSFPSPPLHPLLGGFSLGPPPPPSAPRRDSGSSRHPLPAPAPQGSGAGGDPGAGRRLRPEETLPKQNIIELSDRDCPGTSGPGRAEATACRDSGRGKNGERGRRRRLYPGSAEETRVVAWWSYASTASSSVPRRAFRSCRLSPKEEGSQPTLSAPPLVSEA